MFSLTFVPAMTCALLLTGRVQEKDNLFVRDAKWLYEPRSESHAMCEGP